MSCGMATQINAYRRQRRYHGRASVEADVAARVQNRAAERRRAEGERDRQRRIRLETLNQHRVAPPFPQTRNEVVDRMEVLEISSRIEAFVDKEMYGCRGVLTRTAVMEQCLGSVLVSPHLPSYYLCPSDARVQHRIVEGLQGQLEAVKGVHSREMLAYKSAILDAAVSKGGFTRMGEAMARVLKVRPKNIIKATERRAKKLQSGESEFSLQVRKKRSDVVDSNTVAVVELWWYKETRVSPNRKDTVKEFRYRKDSPSHALHLLLETQVCPNS